MRETMLHFDRELSSEERDKLCDVFRHTGVSCDTTAHSDKPHLMFIAYDEHRAAPHDLVRIAEQSGYRAQVVDL